MKWFDRPGPLTLLATVAVVAHAWVAQSLDRADIWKALRCDPSPSHEIDVYLGVSGVAAFAGGFAGVVIVFALSSDSPVFRRFRILGFRSLRRNSRSVILNCFVAAGLGVGAAVLAASGERSLAAWAFELACVLLVLATARMLWLLHNLLDLVGADDNRVDAKERENSLSVHLFGPGPWPPSGQVQVHVSNPAGEAADAQDGDVRS